MAGEIGHVVYAARLLTYLGETIQDPSYWLGTLFPDIRHLGVVSRHRTHPADVTLKTLSGKTDFLTGMRVHAWIDATREHFLRTAHIKEALPWHPFVPHALKLYEDSLMYSHFDDWNQVHRILNQVDSEELKFVSNETVIRKWHSLVQDYVAKPPSDDSRFALSLGLGLSENSAEEINNVVSMLAKNPKTTTLLESFWRHLEDILR